MRTIDKVIQTPAVARWLGAGGAVWAGYNALRGCLFVELGLTMPNYHTTDTSGYEIVVSEEKKN